MIFPALFRKWYSPLPHSFFLFDFLCPFAFVSPRVAEPELEPVYWSFGSGSRLRLPAPAPGSRTNLSSVFNHNSYWIGSKNWIKSIFFPKSHEKSTFSFKSCENRHPQSSSWSRSRRQLRSRSGSRSRSGNFLKVGDGAGAESNSFGSATLVSPLKGISTVSSEMGLAESGNDR